MKNYLLLIVAVASMLMSSCLKSLDEDDFVLSTTYTGKVVKSNGEPVAHSKVVARTYMDLFTFYTDSEGNFSFTIDYRVFDDVPYNFDIYYGSYDHEEVRIILAGRGKPSCDLGIIHLRRI